MPEFEPTLEANMTASPEEGNLGFTYHTRKNGEVEIWHQGRLASTLRNTNAVDFLQDVQDGTDTDARQLMARITGNYKRGNEHTAKNHPRNRR